MASNVLLTPPLTEPVTLSEMKDYARLSHVADDELLNELIKGAREWCEQYTGRAFISQTWQCALSQVPQAREILLSRSPLLSISCVQVFDRAGTATDWDVENFYVDNMRSPGRVVLHDDAIWPPISRAANGLVIDYVAGYGANASDVPAPIKLAIKQLALHWYENREMFAEGNLTARVPLTVEVLLQSYRIFKIGGTCV